MLLMAVAPTVPDRLDGVVQDPNESDSGAAEGVWVTYPSLARMDSLTAGLQEDPYYRAFQ